MGFVFWKKKWLPGVGGNFLSFPARALVLLADCFCMYGVSCSDSFLCEGLSAIVVLHDLLLPHFFQDDTFLFCFAWVLSLIVM